MIQEDYCSFELSKLLKEKGFDIPSNYAWHGGIKEPDFHRHSRNFNGGEYKDLRTKWYSAPTHQMAMKWLRELYKISIEIYCIPSYTKGLVVWRYMIRNCETCDEVDYPNGYPAQEYLIYEDAVEAALKYCLTKLINNETN